MSAEIKKFLDQAKKGDIDSQYKLASMYQYGRGTSIDQEEAIKWYRKAAEQGHKPSSSMLRTLNKDSESYEPLNENLDRNRQVEKEMQKKEDMDEDELKKYNSKTKHIDAENGDLSAQRTLANDYFLDDEPVKAFKWALLASKQGDASSQHTLGVLYKRGFADQKVDIKEAVRWLTKSADQGDELAQQELFEMYYDGDGVRKDIKKAVKWLKELANNSQSAQLQLAVMYENGEGVAKDYKQMTRWLIKAAINNSTRAQFTLGINYYWGLRVLKDYKEAVKWFTKAAEAKDTPFESFNNHAQEKLARMYIDGKGVLKDYSKAEKYLRMAADEGNTHAQYYLHLYANKMNIDTKESIHWLEKSAGIGESHSEKVKISLYSKPIEQPYADAQYLLSTTLYRRNKGNDRSISKYLIRKAYKNSDKNISKKAEEFWNKRELWCEKDYEYRYKGNDEPSDEQLLKETVIGATYLTLGTNFISGARVLKDPILAIKFFKKEFDEGSYKSEGDHLKYEAALELGILYCEENSVKDFTKSKKWIKEAFECSDNKISKKAEAFWNKNKLWNY
jgi:uncharacterized protein